MARIKKATGSKKYWGGQVLRQAGCQLWEGEGGPRMTTRLWAQQLHGWWCYLPCDKTLEEEQEGKSRSCILLSLQNVPVKLSV